VVEGPDHHVGGRGTWDRMTTMAGSCHHHRPYLGRAPGGSGSSRADPPRAPLARCTAPQVLDEGTGGTQGAGGSSPSRLVTSTMCTAVRTRVRVLQRGGGRVYVGLMTRRHRCCPGPWFCWHGHGGCRWGGRGCRRGWGAQATRVSY
jgi:hypothetical protein